jgi:hypothetical protein
MLYKYYSILPFIQIRDSSSKYASLGPFTEIKHNFMEIFIATDTASVQLFFNIFATGIETFVIPWDQLLNTCVVEVAAWDSNHCVTTISASLSFSKR